MTRHFSSEQPRQSQDALCEEFCTLLSDFKETFQVDVATKEQDQREFLESLGTLRERSISQERGTKFDSNIIRVGIAVEEEIKKKRDGDQEYAFHYVRMMEADKVKELFAKKPDWVHLIEEGKTPLELLVVKFLDHANRPLAKEDRTIENYIKIAACLRDNGAKAKGAFETLLNGLVERKKFSITNEEERTNRGNLLLLANQLSLSTESWETELHNAARDGELEILSNGDNMLTRDKNGFTALHTAVVYGQLDAIRVLVRHRGIRNAKSLWDETARELAFRLFLEAVEQKLAEASLYFAQVIQLCDAAEQPAE